jgi:hypothetical protein
VVADDEAHGALVASGRGQVARLHGGGQQLAAHNAAEYLQLVRSFKGLEAPVAGEWVGGWVGLPGDGPGRLCTPLCVFAQSLCSCRS